MKKRVGFGFLDLVVNILRKNNESTEVNPALKSLSEILAMKLQAQSGITDKSKMRASVLSIQVGSGQESNVIEKVIGGIITIMKKYAMEDDV